MREFTDGGDCGGSVVDQLLLLGNEGSAVAAARKINACNQAKEPEETDDF